MIREKLINQIINNKKAITLDKFIKVCLYDRDGYYSNNDNIFGKSGDFITAPEISQLFGDIIGLFIYSIWKNKINSSFNLVELGPGNCTLLIDILKINKKFFEFQNTLNIKLIEKNKKLIEIQKLKLSENNLINYNINWEKNLENIPNKPTIIYANEFFDCLPIKQFKKKNKDWFEKKVNFNIENKNFFIQDEKISNYKINKYLKNQNDQTILEISKERENYFDKICKFIKKVTGTAIIIDYGYLDIPKNFTLQSIYNHHKSNVLHNPGKQDITSLVNFDQFIKKSKEHKLNVDIFCSQRDFLLSLGINKRKEKVLKKCNKIEQEIIEEGYKRLINKKSMGTLFKVLVVSG